MHIFICNTKIGEKSDMIKSRATFVAQVLISKVKTKVLRNLGKTK